MGELATLLIAWRDVFWAIRRKYGILVAVVAGLMLPVAAIVAIIVALFQFT